MVGLMLVAIIIMIVTGLSLWAVTRRVQKRMKKSLGRKASDLEMASLTTWMRVDEAEQRAEERKPLDPS